MPKIASSKVHLVVCDATDDKALKKAFEWVEENFDRVDILVKQQNSRSTAEDNNFKNI